ncbi:MAG: fimbria/pilus periplasmic chaperone [Cetobacterium somerae]|uniref:fimbria/pilus periplasmic chaperone n=1 Tax=Cetobacterium somerae TaxID=188913 RepID=UPI003F3113A6
MLKKLYISIIFCLFSLIAQGFNFSVAPTRFEVNLDKIVTNEITLLNNTTKPMRIESFIETAPGYEKSDLNESIKLYPKLVSIKPGGKQVVRFRIKPESNIKDGEYKSYVVFKEVPLKEKSKGEIEKVGAQIKMLTELGISVYGYYGNIIKDVKVENLAVNYNKKNTSLLIKMESDSKGNSSELFQTKVDMLDEKGRIIETITSDFGRSNKLGKKKIESLIKLNKLSAKKIRVTILNSNQKVVNQKFIAL